MGEDCSPLPEGSRQYGTCEPIHPAVALAPSRLDAVSLTVQPYPSLQDCRFTQENNHHTCGAPRVHQSAVTLQGARASVGAPVRPVPSSLRTERFIRASGPRITLLTKCYSHTPSCSCVRDTEVKTSCQQTPRAAPSPRGPEEPR